MLALLFTPTLRLFNVSNNVIFEQFHLAGRYMHVLPAHGPGPRCELL